MLSAIRENIERRLGIESKKAPSKSGLVIENLGEFSSRFKNWQPNDKLNNYPFIENEYAPFTPMRRAPAMCWR